MPSHPELLDWLAASFEESGWSIKQMHRLILASATYQRSSRFSQESFDKDGREIMGTVVSELHQKGCTIIAFSHDRVAFKGADILVDLNSKPIPEIVQKSRLEETTSPSGQTTASEAAS